MRDPLKILLVEDDPVLGTSLSTALKIEGYTVQWVKTFQTALETFLASHFDLISLDIGLPDGLGTELCKFVREQDKNIPIIFITAKTDEETLIRGLELGANDFVKKPFSQKELFARIKVLLRSLSWKNQKTVGGLTVFPDRREICFAEKSLPLNRRQFDILVYFLAHPDQIISRDQLLTHLGQDGVVYDRTVDAHLSQLRKVLKTSGVNNLTIAPVYGIGYRLEIE